MHVAITGNIGAGKTTLAGLLAKHYDWEVLYEAVEGNPYLADFYGDMERWAFNLQMFFLKSRFSQVLEIQNSNKKYIQDRTIYEDAYIFAKNLNESKLMSDTDYKTYKEFFDLMLSLIKPPDLMIYLKADLPKLVKQIKNRGRDFENNISEQYLTDLNRHYEAFIDDFSDCKVLIINVDGLDYVNNSADFAKVIEQVDHALIYGK
jgi:deoxyadenosine/deoxycytidine kinase